MPDEAPVVANVSRGLDALILDGVRTGESVHRMHELIPTDRVVFQWGPGPVDLAVKLAVGAVR